MPPPQKPVRPKPASTPPCPPDRYAEVGMMVIHYPDLAVDAKPSLAIVTAIGMDAIDLLVFHPGISGGWPQSGVYHREHQADKLSGDGYWMPRPLDVVLTKFAIAQGLLEWDGESRYAPATKAAVTPTLPSSPPPPPPKA